MPSPMKKKKQTIIEELEYYTTVRNNGKKDIIPCKRIVVNRHRSKKSFDDYVSLEKIKLKDDTLQCEVIVSNIGKGGTSKRGLCLLYGVVISCTEAPFMQGQLVEIHPNASNKLLGSPTKYNARVSVKGISYQARFKIKTQVYGNIVFCDAQ